MPLDKLILLTVRAVHGPLKNSFVTTLDQVVYLLLINLHYTTSPQQCSECCALVLFA